MFVGIEGTSGAGKSTIVWHLAQMLVANGEDVYVTVEPSSGAIGALCRELAESVTDAPDCGLQSVRTFLASADTDALRRIVAMDNERSIFYKNEDGSRVLVGEAAVRLRELNK